MGTNFYCRTIPTKQRKQELCDLINNSNDFYKIKEEINKTYDSFGLNWNGEPEGGVVHLGKRSGGWKFLWNPNIYIIHNGHTEWHDSKDGNKSGTWVTDPDTYFQLYPLTKQGIWDFINRNDAEIYDEYGEWHDKKEFYDEAINWTTWGDKEAWDSDSYDAYEKSQNPSYQSYKCSGEYINMLESKGFILSKNKSDFYSDGLRFATTTEFG